MTLSQPRQGLDPRLVPIALLLAVMPAQGGVASALVPCLLLFLLPAPEGGLALPRRLTGFALAGSLSIIAAAVKAIMLDRGDPEDVAIKVASGVCLLLAAPLLFTPAFSARLRSLRERDWRLLAGALALGLVVALIGLIAMKEIGSWPRQVEKFDRGLSYAAILAPVLALPLGRRAAAGLALLSLAAAAASNSATSQLANLAALAVLLVSRWRIGLATPLVAAGFTALNGAVLSVCLWPAAWHETLRGWYEADRLPFSWLARIEIWHYVGRYAADSPLLGQGWSSTRALPLTGEWAMVLTTHQAHPHNAALQSLVELGLPSLLLMIVAFGMALFAADRAAPHERRAAGLAALAAAAVVAGFGFDFLAGSLWSALFAAAALWHAAPVQLSTKDGMIDPSEPARRNDPS